MGREGYIKVWRRLFEHPIWLNSSPEQKCVLMVLLELANHQPNQWEWKGKPYTVERGQMVTSIASIVEECGKGVTTQNVRSALSRFEKLGFLTNESTKTGRLITIENYSKWQGAESDTNNDTNKELTKSQQRTNKEVTTIKNEKNVKNVKKSNIDTLDLSIFSDRLRTAINDWLTYKEERKEAYKPTGLKSWLKQVENHSKNYEDKYIVEVIEKSMACQYRGVVWDWLKDKPKKQKVHKVTEEVKVVKPEDKLSPEEQARRTEEIRRKLGAIF